MSEEAMHELWLRQASPDACRERLRKTVAALTRARRLQILVDHVCTGLFAGLAIATGGVLLVRLASLAVSPWKLAVAAVVLCVAVSLALGWWRRSDTLQAAIRADLALNLKQRLSTAWELHASGIDADLVDRLAVQAVKAGLPARPTSVFPPYVNRWGLLAPAAAAALWLVSVADLAPMQAFALRTLDERVVAEGQRLGAFARSMQARAERAELPHSTAQAAELERLGGRMEKGELKRSQALDQLQRMASAIEQARSQARSEANRPGSGPGSANAQSAARLADLDAKGMVDRMRSSALGSGDEDALTRHANDLERAGIPRRMLDNALERHRAGEDGLLRDLLERLAPLQRALREDEELRNAYSEVRRAQGNLGDPVAKSNSGEGPAARADWDDEEMQQPGSGSGTEVETNERSRRVSGRQGPRTGSQGDASVVTGSDQAPVPAEPPASAPVLAAQGQLGPGESFTSEARTLPRNNRVITPQAALDARFAAQMESVLANERYPEHYKAFVRRYFLSLSAGAQTPAEQPGRSRGAP